MQSKVTRNKAYRTDIQVLRAIAVVLVVLYHAKIPFLKSGFLGVDIFFVISGFLIGGIIIKQTEERSFSFREFYIRRAWRLLPAAYVVLLSVVLLSPVFLTGIEMKDLFWQIVSALTFTSNVVLWQQAGYFGGEASLKPLLHTWSLAIEEQFYIFLPLLLVLLWGRARFVAVAMLTMLSFVLAVYLRESASAAFYLLPTRAWELLLGVSVALFSYGRCLWPAPRILYFGSILAVLFIPFFKMTQFHPGPQTALICFATAIVLASKPREFSASGSKVVLYVGAMSYSFYLVHWPLFAFLNNMSFAAPWSTLDDALCRVMVLLFSFTLAALLHRFVEERFRVGSNIGKSMFLIAGGPAIALVALLVLSPAQTHSEEEAIAPASPVCETSGTFILEVACQSAGVPRILVWGDSFAMHLVPGLADAGSSLDVGVAHATRSACGPFIGVAQTKTVGGYNQKWAEACIQFNDSVIDALSTAETIDVVVLSSPFSYLIDNQEGLVTRNFADGEVKLQAASFDFAVHALSDTIDQLREIGKRVVVVAPPPSGSFDMGRCGRRLVQGLKIWGVDQDCRFYWPDSSSPLPGPAQLLATVADTNDVDVIQLGDATCSSSICESAIDGIPLYVDGGHLSREGSVWIAVQMDLRSFVWELAR